MTPTQKPSVLVTGALGFIGRHLVERLMQDQARVRVLTRGQRPIPSHWQGKVEVRQGDLKDRASLARVVENVDTAYHLAGEIRTAALYDTINRVGTELLVEACRAAGVQRFIYLSSVGVMGVSGTALQVDEAIVPRPRNAYEASKLAAERAALQQHQTRGMTVSALRPSIVYGEGKSPQGDSFLSCVRMVNSGRFALFASDYVSSYVYVGDVIAACLEVAQDPRTGGQAYIVNEPVPLKAFVAEMAAALGAAQPGVLPPPLGAALENLLRLTGRFASLYNRTAYSMDRLIDLGFQMPYGCAAGLRRTIAWYQETGLLPSGPQRSVSDDR